MKLGKTWQLLIFILVSNLQELNLSTPWAYDEKKTGGPIKKPQNFCSGGHSAKMYLSNTFEKFWQVYKKFAQKFKTLAKIFQK